MRRDDAVNIICSQKLIGSQLSLPQLQHGIEQKINEKKELKINR